MCKSQRGFTLPIVGVIVGFITAMGSAVFPTFFHNARQDTAPIAETATSTPTKTSRSAPVSARVASSSPAATNVTHNTVQPNVKQPATVSSTPTEPSTQSAGQNTPTQTQPAPSVPTLPPPTAAELQGVAYLCTIPQMASQCTITFWNGYQNNAIFRNDIDAIAQQLKQKLAQQSASQAQQAQAACLQASVRAYDPTVTPEANLYIQQSTVHACGLGPAPDQTAFQVSELKTQVQQLQTTVQQQKSAPTVQPTQPSQTCITQPWWDAGVLRFTTKCSPSY